MRSVRQFGLRAARRFDQLLGSLRRRLLPPELVVFEDATSPWLLSALGTLCQLGVPDLVSKLGRVRVDVLAGQLAVPSGDLVRLLRVAVSHGYFRFTREGEVAPTNLSLALTQGRGGHFCRLQASSWYRACFAADLTAGALHSGCTPFEQAFHCSFFELTGREAEKGALFNQAMAEITRFCAPYLAGSLPIAAGQSVLDVGGGNGELCRSLLEFCPGVSFSVLDLEAWDGPVDGVDHLKGNFFESVPAGFDSYLMKNILHDWDDENSRRILSNCREAAEAKAGQLLLLELVLPASLHGLSEAAPDYCVDWNVYCTLGGQERTLQEYRALLRSAGWHLKRAHPTATPLWVLHCELGLF